MKIFKKWRSVFFSRKINIVQKTWNFALKLKAFVFRNLASWVILYLLKASENLGKTTYICKMRARVQFSWNISASTSLLLILKNNRISLLNSSRLWSPWKQKQIVNSIALRMLLTS